MTTVHYWRTPVRNFGDELSPVLVEHLASSPVSWSPIAQARLLAIGSLLATHFAPQHVWSSYRGTIWGSGRMYAQPVIGLPQADVRAVRGRLTLERIQVRDPERVVLGDPGLLAAELLQPEQSNVPTYVLGVMPHWSQREHAWSRSSPLFDRPDVRWIDASKGVMEVLNQIRSCRCLLASSLHGLIAADALGIPNQWLWLASPQDAGASEFKFRDYYSLFQEIVVQPFRPCGRESFQQILDLMQHYSRPGLTEIQARLRASFPFDIFEEVELATRSSPVALGSDVPSDGEQDRPRASARKLQRLNIRIPDRKQCVILTPVSSHVEPACETSLVELERRGYTVWRTRGFSAIDQGRNQMATDALVRGFAETMWIDSDIGFQPDDVDRLRCLGLPLVCGIYPKKGKRELAVHVLPGTSELQFGQAGGLVELLYAGAGFMHVRREVYETIQRECGLPVCNEQFDRPMVPWFQPMIIRTEPDGQVERKADVRDLPDNEAMRITRVIPSPTSCNAHAPSASHWYLAEDFSFCERARRCGFAIWADLRVRLTHIGSFGYSWEDAGADPQRFANYTFRLVQKHSAEP